MSVVYAAYDPELDRKVALKVLRTSTERPDALARERSRLLREAQAMARLAHPNVVPVYDAGSIADQVFLAMHLVD
ncbi:MAG: serine/threonine protein kinase, partial [Nannocystaceae bacterium]|nr:serine/threonine protein kinase [Nannocystaceae bacterium]